MHLADTETVAQSMVDLFGFGKEEILKISAKSNLNVDILTHAIIQKINAPIYNQLNTNHTELVDNQSRILIFDS